MREGAHALDALPTLRYPFPVTDQLITHLPEVRARIEYWVVGGQSKAIARGLDRLAMHSEVPAANFTLETVVRYAEAVGKHVQFVLSEKT